MKNQRVKVIIQNKDTLIQLSVSDSKFILKDLKEKKFDEQIIGKQMVLDSLNEKIILLDKTHINLLSTELLNKDTIITNQNSIIDNKDLSIDILKNEIKQNQKEIRRQKLFKIIGYISTITLGILLIAK